MMGLIVEDSGYAYSFGIVANHFAFSLSLSDYPPLSNPLFTFNLNFQILSLLLFLSIQELTLRFLPTDCPFFITPYIYHVT